MADSLARKLDKLRRDAQAKGHYVVEAAATLLVAEPEVLDRQVNLVGALHEVGALQNRLAPWWTQFRTEPERWATRCLTRLLDHDHDYWALAALLGMEQATVMTEAARLGFHRLAERSCERPKLPPITVVSLTLRHADAMLVPLLELGRDRNGALVDCARARAVLLTSEEMRAGSLVAEGIMTYFCRAALPHGSWRSVQFPFNLAPEVPERFSIR